MIQYIPEGKRFYLEGRALALYEEGKVQFKARNGRDLALVILSQNAPGVNVISRRKR